MGRGYSPYLTILLPCRCLVRRVTHQRVTGIAVKESESCRFNDVSRKVDDPRPGGDGGRRGTAPGGSSRSHSAVTGGATAEGHGGRSTGTVGSATVALRQACLNHSPTVEG